MEQINRSTKPLEISFDEIDNTTSLTVKKLARFEMSSVIYWN